MKTHLALFLALTAAAQAGPRTSASYTVLTDTTGSGGGKSTSAAYSNTGAAGGIAGTSVSTNDTAKAGYVAQLTETTGLTLTAASPSVAENATVQLGAWLALDDATFLAVPTGSVAWSVTNGPLTIASTGLATGGIVYQNTAATAQGIHLGYTATLGLTVANTLPDNFGTYAADGLDDDWQNQYFGLNNPNAAPTFDADFDGHNNLFEFTAGLNPTQGSSRFLQDAARPTGQPTQMNIVISPRLPGRTYTVKTSTTLGPSAVWTPLTGFTVTDNGTTRIITDTSATGARKFYTVEISKP